MKKEVWTGLLVLVFLISVNAQQTPEYGSYHFALENIERGYKAAAGAEDENAMAFYEGMRSTLQRGGGLIYVQLGSQEQSYLQKYGGYGSPESRYRVVGGAVERYSWVDDYLLFGDGWVPEDKVTPANLGVQQVSFLPGSADGGLQYGETRYGDYCPT